MTALILCDKCAIRISDQNINIPAHRIIIDGQEWHVCEPCMASNDYANLIPGADNIIENNSKEVN